VRGHQHYVVYESDKFDAPSAAVLSNLNTVPCLAGQGVRGVGGSLQWAAETSGIPVAFSQPGALDSQSPGPAACLLWSLLRTALSGMRWQVTLCGIAMAGSEIDLNYIHSASTAQ